VQSPIIVTFLMPTHNCFDFSRFYDEMSIRGFVIYPGKLALADSFRIGCIGALGPAEMREAVAAVKVTLEAMGIDGLAKTPMDQTDFARRMGTQ